MFRLLQAFEMTSTLRTAAFAGLSKMPETKNKLIYFGISGSKRMPCSQRIIFLAQILEALKTH